ncbi:MlaD family protein [Spirochaetota bacterium]
MIKLERNEWRVGLFIIIPVAIALILILLKLGYSIATTTVDVYLKIDNLKSVKEGTPVEIKGFNIGRVVEVKPIFKPALHFLATMRIKKNIEIFDGCTVLILKENVIGDPIVEFRNPEKKGELLKHGDVVEGVEHGDILATIQNINKVLISVKSAVDNIDSISKDSRHKIRSLMANLASSSGNFNKILITAQKDIFGILASFRQTAKTMHEISTEFKKHPVTFLFKKKDK